MSSGVCAFLWVAGCAGEQVGESVGEREDAQELPEPSTSSGDASSPEEGENRSDTEDSLPKTPNCEELVKVKLEDDQFLVRPGTRVADLLAPVTKPIPFRFEAKKDNQFSLTPDLDGVRGTLHLEYKQSSIKYEYWKQPESTRSIAEDSILDGGCNDVLTMPATMRLQTQQGSFDESMLVYLRMQFKAGRPIDLSEFVVETMIEVDQFTRFLGKFQLGEPRLAPGDVVGGHFYNLAAEFTGGVPRGWFGAFQEVLVEGSDASGPRIPVVSAFYRIVPSG